MNYIFSDLLDVCIMIYIDNILIYSNNVFIHYLHNKKVLKYLYKASLYVKVEKYEFYSGLELGCGELSTKDGKSPLTTNLSLYRLARCY